LEPDQLKGDGIYSGRASFQIKRVDVGTYLIEVSAQDPKGFSSNTLIVPLEVIRTNRPPVLSDLQAPDTVNTSVVSQFLITVNALDPDGLADIKSVTRTTPSGLVFTLNDQGVNGDVRAGDGTFSETVAVNDPSPPPGDYLFKFQAFDRSNEGSNVIIHRVTVRQ
jgi:hypothetical protein